MQYQKNHSHMPEFLFLLCSWTSRRHSSAPATMTCTWLSSLCFQCFVRVPERMQFFMLVCCLIIKKLCACITMAQIWRVMCNAHNPSTQLYLTNDSWLSLVPKLNKINVWFYTPVKVHFLDTGTEIIVSLVESGNYKMQHLTRKIWWINTKSHSIQKCKNVRMHI